MAFTLYSLIQAAVLCVNAVAVLHEERFLCKSKSMLFLLRESHENSHREWLMLTSTGASENSCTNRTEASPVKRSESRECVLKEQQHTVRVFVQAVVDGVVDVAHVRQSAGGWTRVWGGSGMNPESKSS